MVLALAGELRADLQYTLQDLNGSAAVSVATGVNNSGQVVGRANTGGQNAYGYGFIWSGGTMTPLGAATEANSINDLGQVVGTVSYSTSFASGTHAALFSSGTTTDLGTLYGGNSSALDINNAGQITGWSGDFPGSGTPFLYSGGAMYDLGSFGNNAAGYAINNSGQIVGKSNGYTFSGYRGFLYSGGTMTQIPLQNSDAPVINDAGNVVGSYSGDNTYLYSGGGLSGVFPGGDGVGLNNAGQILVMNYNVRPSSLTLLSGGNIYDVAGLVTNGGGYANFYTSGAKAINDWGQIAATAYVGSTQHAVLLSPTTPFLSTSGGTQNSKVIAGMNFHLVASWTNPNDLHTVANLLDGLASANRDVMESFISPITGHASDTLNFSGTGSDTFVLRMSYDEALANSLFGNASLARLDWLDPSDNTWKNAVLGNTGGTPFFAGDGAYNSATDFQLGWYGVDTANNEVWAVVNHNSEFSVFNTASAPEPSGAMLALIGGAALLLRRRRI